MINELQMIRTNTAHVGTGAIASLTQSAKDTNGVSNKGSFDSFLIDAVSSMNDKQQMASNISEQVIIDPDSVDVHDVTIAMAEANLSLTLANTVISRITQAWSEITTTR